MRPELTKSYKHKKKRHRSRRAALSRISLVFVVIGSVCVGLGIIMLAWSQFLETRAHRQMLWGLWYIGIGTIMILLRFAIKGLIRLLETRAIRHHRVIANKNYAPPTTPSGERLRSRAIPSREDGSILVLTLVLLGLLSGLILQSQFLTRSSLMKTASLADQAQLYLAAQDDILTSVRSLLADPDPDFDHLAESWAKPRETLLASGISLLTRVEDASRYFDLNNLALPNRPNTWKNPAEISMDLLNLSGDFNPVHKVQALADWVDEDDNGFQEDQLYQDRKPPYQTPDRPLHTMDEILLVDEFSRELFQPRPEAGGVRTTSLQEMVTVLPGERTRPSRININTADRAVLTGVFGMDHVEIVDRLLLMRELKPISAITSVQLAAQPVDISAILPYLDVASTHFVIRSRAWHEGASVNISALVRQVSPTEMEIVQWVF